MLMENITQMSGYRKKEQEQVIQIMESENKWTPINRINIISVAKGATRMVGISNS